MFTGIITDVAAVRRSQLSDGGLMLTFARPKNWDDLVLGESINTDGVCLTIAAIRDDEYDCFLMPETLAKTTFGSAVPKNVSLERALAAGDRFGGHFVQGHVDSTGVVKAIDQSDGWRLSIGFPTENDALVIPKGSITVNGVSLTVAALEPGVLTVALIPHTLEHTTIGDLKTGDSVNLEFDMLGKYIVNVMEKQSHAKGSES